MTLLYRSVVSDERPGMPERLRSEFENWVRSKSYDVEVPVDGHSEDVPAGVTVKSTRAADNDVSVLRLRLEEDRGHEHWQTTFVGITGGETQWILTDVEHVSDDPYGHPPRPAPPNLVGRLVAQGSCATGHAALDVNPIIATGDTIDEFVRLLTHVERSAPVVAIGHDRQTDDADNMVRAAAVCKKLQGIAPVWLLTADAVYEFSQPECTEDLSGSGLS